MSLPIASAQLWTGRPQIRQGGLQLRCQRAPVMLMGREQTSQVVRVMSVPFGVVVVWFLSMLIL